MGDPTITRHDDGTLTVGWPDPPLRTYEVAHEALRFLVDDYNEVVAEANRLRVQRDRLADGIREHRDHDFAADPTVSKAATFREMRKVNERLWALLDVAGDDREDDRE